MKKSFLPSTLWCAALMAASLSVTSCTSENGDTFSEQAVAIAPSAIVQELNDGLNATGARIVDSIADFPWVFIGSPAADTVEAHCWHSFLLARRPSIWGTSLVPPR